MLAVKVVALSNHMGPGREAALRREALVLELAAMQDYRHPHLMPMQVRQEMALCGAAGFSVLSFRCRQLHDMCRTTTNHTSCPCR
jgi:hypothetical protein